MRVKNVLLGAIAALLYQSGATLQKTEDEAVKFLVDGGHISENVEVDSFFVDRNGNIKLRFIDGDKTLNFGLEESQDTYEIIYMSKKKIPSDRKKSDSNDQIARLIGDRLSIFKGGKVINATRPPGSNKNGNINVIYQVKSNKYEIEAIYDAKRGEFSINKVKELVPESKDQL